MKRAPSRQQLAHTTSQLQQGTVQIAIQFGSFVQMSFWARVRWFFTGRYDERLALRNAQAAQRALTQKGTD